MLCPAGESSKTLVFICLKVNRVPSATLLNQSLAPAFMQTCKHALKSSHARHGMLRAAEPAQMQHRTGVFARQLQQHLSSWTFSTVLSRTSSCCLSREVVLSRDGWLTPRKALSWQGRSGQSSGYYQTQIQVQAQWPVHLA